MASYYNFGSGDKSGCATWLLALVIGFVAVIVACGFGLLFAFPEMWLWNWLVPSLFNGPEISYWQMVGLHILCTFLFKSSTTVNSSK